MKEFWINLDRRSRAALVGAMALVVAALVGSAVWLLQTDYQVLFADLKPQDTAAMVAELDRQKIPYRIARDGNTILVAAEAVHPTRLKLMGKDIPLHGAAGFELFNNADFGMTEFAQKINYQRALQGEITRTILSLAEVRNARVHLALPEQGLFKRATAKGKAAITLSLKLGAALRGEQVKGIQRLVAAAVPGIAVQDVTIVDERGVALTRSATEGDQESTSARLDLKKETEQLLARKATEVLDRALGAGQAIASVDVTLNMDVMRTTSEEVLGASGRTGTGVLVREREVVRDAAAPLDQRPDSRPASTQREVEYQTGRRIEQVVSQPGAIRRMQLVAVVSKPMDAHQLEQLRTLLAAAVGALEDRGDAVVVQSLKTFETGDASAEAPGRSIPDEVGPVATQQPEPAVQSPSVLAAGALIATVLLAAGLWTFRRKVMPEGRTLSEADRVATLRQLEAWLGGGAVTSAIPKTGGARPGAGNVT